MNDKLMFFIKERDVVIPNVIFKNYITLGITSEELILLIYVYNLGDKVLYNPEIYAKEFNMSKYKVMEIINSLLEKNVISLDLEKGKNGKMEEYLSLELLYNKVMRLILGEEEEEDKKSYSDIFSMFESEFARTLSPMEYEIIKSWINEKVPEDLIKEALKEAIYNGVNNLRYIEKILQDWKKKGYRSKTDIVKDKERYMKSKAKVSVFDYNWLDDE